MNRPTIDSTPGTCGGRPETVPPKTTSSRPRSSASTIPHATCTRVAMVRPRLRANARRVSARSVGSEYEWISLATVSAAVSALERWVDVSTPRSASCHARSEVSGSCFEIQER